jgi:hypothetical protein
MGFIVPIFGPSSTVIWTVEMKARPPPKPKASLVTMHFDYSDSQLSFADSFYADPDYPIDSYLSGWGY